MQSRPGASDFTTRTLSVITANSAFRKYFFSDDMSMNKGSGVQKRFRLRSLGFSFLAISCVKKGWSSEVFRIKFSQDSQQSHKIKITIRQRGPIYQSYLVVAFRRPF